MNSSYVLWLVLAVPAASLLNSWLGADPFYGQMINTSGDLSARLLILTMAITPLRLMFPQSGWSRWLLLRRRYFGVASFVYAMMHTLIYIDRKQSIDLILKEAADVSIWTGWLALAIFIVLAITSNDASVRWLKRAWKKVHRWVYPAALLTFMHWIFSAFNLVPALVHLSVLVSLESYRIWKTWKLKTHGA